MKKSKRIWVFVAAWVCGSMFCSAYGETYSGSCGDGVKWELNTDESTLRIAADDGSTGKINDYNEGSAPWATYKDNVVYLSISKGVTSVGKYAFCNLPNLKTVNFTSTSHVEAIGYGAFCKCSSLSSIAIPNSVTSIGNAAFSDCSSLSSVPIPNGITSIGESVLSGCSGLTSVTIPNSITSIGKRAFYGCSGLKSVTIPNSVTSIGENAFQNCSSLTAVHISDLAAWCKIAFDATESNPLYYAHNLYLNNELITDLVIPNSITVIKSRVFSYCYSLQSVTIPNSVTSIEERAFLYCSNLTSVTIPNSVTSIGSWAFRSCGNLPSVTIPNSVTSIGEYAFQYCRGLKSITIPNSVTSIGKYAFSGCIYLKSVIWNAKNHPDFSKEQNPFYEIRDKITSFTFGEDVEKIPAYICSGMSNLSSIEIPFGITYIHSNAFSGCSGLSAVIWNVKSHADFSKEQNPFYEICNQITSFTFGEEVKKIPAYMCYGMSNLSSIEIPNSVTTIGYDAFAMCEGLTSVKFGNNLNTIENQVFRGCSGLTSIDIPNSVTSIGNGIFWGCSGLTSVTIPDGITSIGDWFFLSCEALTSIEIPSSVSNIGDYAFYDCKGLTSIICHAETHPTCGGSSVFEGVNKDIPLYVPDGSVDDYNYADQWKAFNVKGLSSMPTGVEEVPSDQVQSTKVIENGQLYIRYKGTKYNVLGQVER